MKIDKEMADKILLYLAKKAGYENYCIECQHTSTKDCFYVIRLCKKRHLGTFLRKPNNMLCCFPYGNIENIVKALFKATSEYSILCFGSKDNDKHKVLRKGTTLEHILIEMDLAKI